MFCWPATSLNHFTHICYVTCKMTPNNLVFITTLAQALKRFQSYVYVHAAYSVTDH